VLAEFGITKSNLAYVDIYLADAGKHSDSVIELFKEYLGQHRPAGTLVGVSYFAFPAQLVEISAVAYTD
jgi:2-iminobutanoate/2-iminopropanoate deaminase